MPAGRIRLAVVSAADPVDRATGRLVHLPDAPFLVGELAPVELLAALVDGPVIVDNDVNWAARAERDAADGRRSTTSSTSTSAKVWAARSSATARYAAGTPASPARSPTCSPRPAGRARSRSPRCSPHSACAGRASTAIDVERSAARSRLAARGLATRSDPVAAAVCGVLAAVVALADPEVVVIGGTWGTRPGGPRRDHRRVRRLPRHVPIRTARVTDRPSLAGARDHALARLRAAVASPARP